METENAIKIMEAYHRLFTSADGVLVLNDMEVSYQNRASFVPGDPHYTAFKEGQRSTLLNIRAMMLKIEELRRPGAKKQPDNYIGDNNG